MIDGMMKVILDNLICELLLTGCKSSLCAHKLKDIMKRLDELVVSRGRRGAISRLIP